MGASRQKMLRALRDQHHAAMHANPEEKHMTIDIKEWVNRRVRPHFENKCDGITNEDCIGTIENDLVTFVKQVRVDTIAGLVKAIKSVAPELEHGDPVHGLADELEKLLDFRKWEEDAEKFLMEAVGRPPTCVYCFKTAKHKMLNGPFLCGEVRCHNDYREGKKP